MSGAAEFELARCGWGRLWQAPARDTWGSGPLTFLPFDRLTVLHERLEIEAHWRGRRSEYRFVEDRWTPIAGWPLGSGFLLAADVSVALEHRGEIEWRRLTLTVLLEVGAPGMPGGTLQHLGEAAPAALPGILAGYAREARG